MDLRQESQGGIDLCGIQPMRRCHGLSMVVHVRPFLRLSRTLSLSSESRLSLSSLDIGWLRARTKCLHLLVLPEFRWCSSLDLVQNSRMHWMQCVTDTWLLIMFLTPCWICLCCGSFFMSIMTLHSGHGTRSTSTSSSCSEGTINGSLKNACLATIESSLEYLDAYRFQSVKCTLGSPRDCTLGEHE